MLIIIEMRNASKQKLRIFFPYIIGVTLHDSRNDGIAIFRSKLKRNYLLPTLDLHSTYCGHKHFLLSNFSCTATQHRKQLGAIFSPKGPQFSVILTKFQGKP